MNEASNWLEKRDVYKEGQKEVLEKLDWLMSHLKTHDWVRPDILKTWEDYKNDNRKK